MNFHKILTSTNEEYRKPFGSIFWILENATMSGKIRLIKWFGWGNYMARLVQPPSFPRSPKF